MPDPGDLEGTPLGSSAHDRSTSRPCAPGTADRRVGGRGSRVISHDQRTWAIDDGRPLHAEAGYVRPGLHGSWEWVNAQPSGFVEVYAGALDGTTLRFESSLIARTPTAKRVDRLRRVVHMAGSSIDYTLEMAAVGHPLQLHLTALLRRVAN